MSSSGIGAITALQRYRYLQNGGEVPTDSVLIADGGLAQQGCALAIGVSAPGYNILGRAHYNWAPLFSASWPSFSPWDETEEASDTPWFWPQLGEGHRVQAAMRCEMRVGGVSQFWWADLRQGIYRVPPCDEFRVQMWVRDWVGPTTPIPEGLQPITCMASLTAAPQQWKPDPYTCTCETMLVEPPGPGVSWTGSLKALPPYTKRWRSQILAWGGESFDGVFLQTQVSAVHAMGNDYKPGDWQEPVDGPVRASWSVPDRTGDLYCTLRVIAEVGP